MASWMVCPQCENSDETEIKDRDYVYGKCECAASDPALIYNDPDLDEPLECECEPEQLRDHLLWLLWCKRCKVHFESATETDRY